MFVKVPDISYNLFAQNLFCLNLQSVPPSRKKDKFIQ